MQTDKFTIIRSLRVRLASCLLILLTGAGCATDTSYDRHNLSRVWLSQDGSQIFFDATASTAYPAESAEAEAIRLVWLSDWLKLRKFCTGGHRISERRAIRDDEYNPQRHNLRYQIECI